MPCDRKNIWNYAQNKPTLVVKDITDKYPDVDPNFIYEVLLTRGVFKWFAVRRDLIKLKNIWRNELVKLNRKKNKKEKGYHDALVKCRRQVRELCHSERFRAPDFDRYANRYLSKIEEENNATI